MSTLIEQLEADYAATTSELKRNRRQFRILKWKRKYITTLLESAAAQDGEAIARRNRIAAVLKLHRGLKIAQVAIEVLRANKEPMSAMEIARTAVQCGYDAGDANIERVRSHFSAVISKSLRSKDSDFWQVGRGKIGLAEWNQDHKRNYIPILPGEDRVMVPTL